MIESGNVQRRIAVGYFEGVNALVGFNMGSHTEMVHAENARSKVIGTIEKREGQTVLGTNINGFPFVTTNNYGLFSFQNIYNQGLYRISVNQNPTLSINTSDTLYASDAIIVERTDQPISHILPLSIGVADTMFVSEKINNNTGTLATIYYLNSANQWVPLTGFGTNIPGGSFDYAYAEGCVFLVNQNSPNRYIKADGVTVVDSSDATGHLYNTPQASVINYYKSRLYLADFVQGGIKYPTTVLRSSYAMGIISLFNDDYPSAVSGVPIDVTSTKYFYTVAGANQYDVYRGPNLISTITVTSIGETNITATWTGTPSFQASDEIWLKGTYNGAKIFRWVNNPTITGTNVQQFDTFKLSGGENDAITMLTNIGNVMLISNKNTMGSWNDYTLENFDLNIGCVSRKGFIKVLGTLYFLHYTGVYSTTGGTPNIISNKVQPYITGATKFGLENSAAGKKGQNIFFTLGDVTLYKTDGSVNKILHDVCLEYNLIQQNWYVHTNVKASEFATFLEEVNPDRLEFIDTAGNHAVKEFLNGETDDGDAIHFRIDTMKYTLGVSVISKARAMTAFEYSSRPIALLTEVERGSSVRAYVNLENNEEYYPLEGSLAKGYSHLKITEKGYSRGQPPTARLLSVSFRDSSKQLCKLSRFSIIYLPTTEEDFKNDY